MNILILGDSWGLGEWRNQGNTKIIDPMLTNLGHNVVNLSQESANYDMILEQAERLEKKQKRKKIISFDIVFVFVTAACRSWAVTQEDGFNLFWPDHENPQYYLERKNQEINRLCKGLSSRFKNIKLIGGLDRVDNHHVKDFPNIEIATNFLELIIPDYLQYDVSLQDCLHTIPYNSSKKLINWIWDQHKKWTYCQTLEIMNPDGCHPNKEGHTILGNYLIKKYSL